MYTLVWKHALYEYFSRLLTPEVQYLCKNVLILFHNFYRKAKKEPMKANDKLDFLCLYIH
jgi:hypothetical protein